MSPEWIYLLKANVGIALFYAFYKLFCCNDILFQWRRMALMGVLVVSFLYPLVDMQEWIREQPSMNELADHYATWMQVERMDDEAESTAQSTPSVLTCCLYLYRVGVIVLAVRFLMQLASIFRMAWKSGQETIDGCRVFSLPTATSPFSFFGWIFLYLPALNPEVRSEVMKHERTHVSQWHSLDVVFSELVCILCWFNPFVWLMKSEIRLNLEYLADHRAIKDMEDVKPYQYHLLRLANPGHPMGIYNHFNVSFLKRRIVMMNRKPSRQRTSLKYLMFFPLGMILLLVSNIESVARSIERNIIIPPLPVQEVSAPVASADINHHPSVDEKNIYDIVQHQAAFPGGWEALMKHLRSYIKYPIEAIEQGIGGTVPVRIVIDKDGSVKSPVVLRSIHPSLDKEALRVVQTLPRWTPAKQHGEVVASYFTIPVKFKIYEVKP